MYPGVASYQPDTGEAEEPRTAVSTLSLYRPQQRSECATTRQDTLDVAAKARRVAPLRSCLTWHPREELYSPGTSHHEVYRDQGYIDPSYKKNPSLTALMLGCLEKDTPLPAHDLVIDDSQGVLEVVDARGRLGLDRLPRCEGYLYRALPVLRRTRYVVISECTLSWYCSREVYYRHGLKACLGSVNFILHQCTMSQRGANGFAVTDEFTGKVFAFDVPRGSLQRGEWMSFVLLAINKAASIRRRFATVPWELLQFEAVHRLHFLVTSTACTTGFCSLGCYSAAARHLDLRRAVNKYWRNAKRLVAS